LPNLPVKPSPLQRPDIRGLQFYTFFGISTGIKQRLIDIAKKITFYFLQNFLLPRERKLDA
jgi:hypothetical protein